MAVIKHTVTRTRGGEVILSWEGLGQGDTADEAILPEYNVRSAHVLGDFSGGALASIRGSNEPDLTKDNFEILVDPQGGAVTFGSAGIKRIEENIFRLKPTLAVGDGSTDLDVHVLAKGVK